MKRYYFLAAIAIILGAGLIFLPEKENHRELAPEKLLYELDDQSRFLSPDQVAELIISQDPTLLLVDVRDKEEFDTFSLIGAIHIPLKDILAKENEQYFNREALQVVFYSNDDVKSEQAWLLNKRAEYMNMFILKGGLNQWTKDIMQPKEPASTASQDEFDLYNFRQAACKFFAGGSIEIEPTDFVAPAAPVAKKSGPIPKKQVKLIPKPVVEEEEEEEGC